jgi:formate-dependent nitrite reductase membrane component NrfD
MISAVVWHWWLGAGLLIAGIGAVLSVVAGYIKQVTALKYPNRRQRQAQK